MIVKVPRKITVGAYDITIAYVSKLCCDYKLLGQAITDRQLIKLEPDTSGQTNAVTLFHEITHAINDSYSCELDEHNIDRIAHGIVSILVKDFGIELDWSDIRGV